MYTPLYASLSMQHNTTKRFGRVPAGMEYTLLSTDRIGCLTVLFSRVLMCVICTVGFMVAFFANKVALTMFSLKSGLGPPAMIAKAGLLRNSRILTSTPLMMNLSCRKRSTWRRPIISTSRLFRMFSHRTTNPSLAAGPSAISTASMRMAVSLCHS